ncbi:cytochrome P450 [Nocardia sp. GAS34]|uniref:cytochrome P450 n=1 Tax=unclassified Nocardia TaxID=2637762 RepID=UPI003D22FDBE
MSVDRTVPVAPYSLPLIGHIGQILRDPLRFLTTLPHHGSVVKVKVGLIDVVVVCDANLTNQIFRDDKAFDKGGPIFDRGREVIGNGLVTCSHRDHRRQRRLIQAAFTAGRMPAYAAIMTGSVADAMNCWGQGSTVDVFKTMQSLSCEIAVKTLFADAGEPDIRQQALDSLAQIFDNLPLRLLIPASLDTFPTPSGRRYNQARRKFRTSIGAMVASHQARQVDQGDLLSALLVARDEFGHVLSESEIVDQALTFFLAGSETTAAILSWAFFLLGRHPQVKERLHREVDEVLHGRCATIDDVPQLRFTRQVMTETLRLYPPGWMLTRTATADTSLGGYFIAKGTTVAYSPYILHRGSAYENPESFDPDRWETGRSAAIPRTALVPFGGGARKCIGDSFAMMESVIVLASIASSWDLQPQMPGTVRPGIAFTLYPKKLKMLPVRRGQRNPGFPNHIRTTGTPYPEVEIQGTDR